ncbi:hypothetical protein A9Q99_00205 [Gammaproteobacteria bacterium 45_16_T64]|nr:hypothetical protein A9Q99_00205 [Gammaproteobacteria bacterium 45_16_T64]
MTAGYPCNVLVVDDLPANLLAMDAILGDLDNVNLVHAKNGVEALQCVLKQRFALMLLDVNMPEMDGYEVAHLVSNNPYTKYLPIVMVTALGQSDEEVLKAYQAGAVDYIVKPIQNDILINKVKQFVELYRAHEKAAQSLLEMANLRKEKEVILNAAGEGIVKINSKGEIEYANQKALNLLKVPSDRLIHSHFNLWFAGKHDEDMFSQLYEHLTATQQDQRYRLDILISGGRKVPIEAMCTHTEDTNGSLASVIVLFQDITERLAMEGRLIRLANYDPLTGLSNRAYFHDSLLRAIARSKRSGSTVALYTIDLDRFKQVNDTLGHDIGDALLQDVSSRLRDTLREVDVISRLGGDEFAVIVEDLDGGEDSGTAIAAKLVKELALPYYLTAEDGTKKELVVECSVGVAFCHGGDLDEPSLVKASDLALYEAKRGGRNTFRTFATEMSEHSKKHASIEQMLRSASVGDSLCLHYQPQICLSEHRVTGFEALVRWFPTDPNIAPVSPAVFIPIAEQTRLIHSLGENVLYEACEQLQQWSTFYEKHDLTLSVNLSAKQLSVPNFIHVIDRVTSPFNFERHRMVFEITETAVLDHGHSTIDTLIAIKERGFGLSLDDFGTGYSSLSYLQKLPVDYLKIDRCFIQDMNQNPKNLSLVKAIMAIAETFSLDVVAEGVESREELQCLAELHCDKIQGYYFSKPVPPSEAQRVVEDILKRQSLFSADESRNVTSIRKHGN